MPEVIEAHRAYKQAEADALALQARARARLGLAIERELATGTQVTEVAALLGVGREQIRRYREGSRDWSRDNPGETP